MSPRWVLAPFSAVYGMGITVWKKLYQIGVFSSGKVSVPVVSVGNVTVGGNGKTPLVIALGKALSERGHVVGILSRGYGRQSSPQNNPLPEVLIFSFRRREKGVLRLESPPGLRRERDVPEEPTDNGLFRQTLNVQEAGDEPALIAEKLPDALIGLSSDRLTGAQKLVEAGATVILMDDGFQSLELLQDLSFVLLAEGDFRRILQNGGWGVSDLLPGGRFREGVDSLRRATALVVTLEREWLAEEKVSLLSSFESFRQKKGLSTTLSLLFQKTEVLGVDLLIRGGEDPDASGKEEDNEGMAGSVLNGETLPATVLKEKRVALISAIARPERFSRLVESMGASVMGHLIWKDHAPWTAGRKDEINRFLSRLPERPEMVLITEKDRVKWPRSLRLGYDVLSIAIGSHLVEPGRWERLLPEVPEERLTGTSHGKIMSGEVSGGD